ncbi:uncharacterized protein LAESUDRAFT_747468 [Laetiporus sulphureus 93-53]|uniref:Uncharacterized protein n=1 Tax=Laetiporus sulphureus 93-53 TaxID=1314785 RepID=A0A165GV28_9APHY|nr:uncharacterized protein LAESUDRAFT_747468 [Laetiporus sulphureus 93-53]KZT10855.1 hypothetical protein LAESUDRAFT_747468 [Laetiporus sulphureus 93-53]
MALKKYLSTFLRRRRSSSSTESPLEARLDELRQFWKATFQESLSRGDEYRAAATMHLRRSQEVLSGADMWHLQTMHDGLVVEREELSDFAQSPERLSFDIVSRASHYKSRAKSLYTEVREVVRRSQTSLEAVQTQSEHLDQESRVPGTTSPRIGHAVDIEREHIESPCQGRSQSGSIDHAVPELCNSPTDSELSSMYACQERLSGPEMPQSAITDYFDEPPLYCPWDPLTVENDFSGYYQSEGAVRTAAPRGHQVLDGRNLCFRTSVQCPTCYRYPLSLQLPPVHLGSHDRHSVQSGYSEVSGLSLGPATPRSSPQSSVPSQDLSSSPNFLKTLDEALRGLDTPLQVPAAGSTLSSVSVGQRSPAIMVDPYVPSPLPERSVVRMVSAGARGMPANPTTLPFRPIPDLRRSISQPLLTSRRARTRPMLTKEALAQLSSFTSELSSSVTPLSDDGYDDDDDHDLLNDDCTVEVASVVVQPYGHSRTNTVDLSFNYI